MVSSLKPSFGDTTHQDLTSLESITVRGQPLTVVPSEHCQKAHAKTDGAGHQKGDEEPIGHLPNLALSRPDKFVCAEERANRLRDMHG